MKYILLKIFIFMWVVSGKRNPFIQVEEYKQAIGTQLKLTTTIYREENYNKYEEKV